MKELQIPNIGFGTASTDQVRLIVKLLYEKLNKFEQFF